MGEKSLGESRVRWDAGFRSPLPILITQGIYVPGSGPPPMVMVPPSPLWMWELGGSYR